MLEIRLLGQFDLRRNGRSVELHSRPGQSLLAYLALRPGIQHRREKLAGLFWPEMPEGNARRNLRHALWQIRTVTGDGFVHSDRLALSLDPEAPHWIDVADLKESCNATGLDELTAAVSLYRGELLPGFYDDWVSLERERIRMVYMRCMDALLSALETEARWSDVLLWAERWMANGGPIEPAYRSVMRAHGALGDIAGVASAFGRCSELLQSELGVAPSAETRALYRQLAEGTPPGNPNEFEVGVASTLRPVRPFHGTSKFALLRRLTGSRLIGRDYEMADLHDFWNEARNGRAHFLLLTGQGGVGKTRLVSELAQDVQRWGGAVLHGHYYADLDVPYLGIWEALRDHFRSLEPQQASDVIAHLAAELAKLIPEIAEFAGTVTAKPPLGTVAAERVRLFDHVCQFIARLAKHKPLLLILDDLHWADDASLQLLAYVIRHSRTAPVLFVGTARDDEIRLDHPLQQTLLDLNRERLYTRLKLLPLQPQQVRRLLSTLLAGPAGSGLVDAVIAVAGGNPLFVEEVTKSLLENDAIGLVAGQWQLAEDASIEVPHTLDMMINTRVAGLSEDCQKALRGAAILGQVFGFAALRLMLEWPENRLRDTLDESLKAGLVTIGDDSESGRYQFSHGLVQQALYETLGAWERAEAHLTAGKALERVCSGAIDEHVEVLAYHFMRSHEEGVIKAAGYLMRAAEKAAAVYAHDQAISYLRRGLDLLSRYPTMPGGVQDEIRLLLALGPLVGNTAGRWDDEVGRIFSRARELLQEIEGPLEQAFTATRGLWLYHFSTSNAAAIEALSDELLLLAETSGDSGLLLEAYHTLWGWEFGRGRTRQAQEYFERGRALFDFERHNGLSRRFGHDPGTCCLNMGALNLWLMGFPTQALVWSREAYELGQKMALPFDRLCGINACVWVHEMRGEYQKAAEWNKAKLALARETDFPQFVIGALGSQGLVLAWQGLHREAFATVQEAMEKNRATSRYEPLTFMRFLQVCFVSGHIAEGLRAVEEELTRNKIAGERGLEAEIRRLYGELIRVQAPDDAAAAEAQFDLALEIARHQGARSLELRAAMSLARSWQDQGRTRQARRLLEPIYSWFSEGFETADLREARRLLERDLAS